MTVHSKLIQSRLIYPFLTVYVLSTPLPALPAEPAALDWYRLDEAVNAEIAKTGLKQALRTEYGGTETERLMRSFDLATRLGDDKTALASITALRKCKQLPSEHDLSEMSNFLIGREQWRLAKAFLELFPEAHPGWGYVFVKHWLKESSSPVAHKEIDDWLAARSRSNPESSYWLLERMRFHGERGTEKSFLEELAAEVKLRPADISPAMRYVEAAELARQRVDLSWLSDTFKPAQCFQQFQFGEKLSSRWPAVAEKYLEMSLAHPFTPSDKTQVEALLRKMSAMPMMMMKTNAEQILRTWTKQCLANCYHRTNQDARAQKLLVELSKELPAGMPSYALTRQAGAIQIAVPDHPLEQMIKKAEPENTNSTDYWLGRASYYEGRKDDPSAVEAFEKALALTKVPLRNETAVMMRRRAIDDYCHYLRRTKRSDKATALWWKEFEASDNPELKKRIVDSLWHADSSLLVYNDARLWTYLSQKKSWELLDQHILQSMLSGPKADKEYVFKRAEELSAEGDATRARVLGWIMTRNQQSKRAIPLLKRAASQLADPEAKKWVQFNLFEAYLDTGEWQTAEKHWTDARQQLTSGEIPGWLSRIAVAAAKAGAREDALRIWQRKDEFDRTLLSLLQDLCRFGMKEKLLDYYAKMEKQEPSSSVPRAARKLIGG